MAETPKTTASEQASGLTAYRLVVLYSPVESDARVCELGDAPLRIGRLAQPDEPRLVLDHDEVSREHAELEPEPRGGFALRDLGSHNGTFVNRERVTRRVLAHGDVLRVGNCLLLFQVLESTPGPLGSTTEPPPLRERREDILALAHSFLERAGLGTALDADAAEALVVHGWPFDARELEQTVGQAARAGDGSGIRFSDLPPRLRVPAAAERSELPTTLPLGSDVPLRPDRRRPRP